MDLLPYSWTELTSDEFMRNICLNLNLDAKGITSGVRAIKMSYFEAIESR
jgi:hypothetical protein